VEALKEDLAPFPLARNALFDAPPSAYLEEQQQGQQQQQQQGQKGG
jgi:hypothetical protein